VIQAAYKSQVKKSVRSPSVKGWSSEHEAHPISPPVPGARGAGCGPAVWATRSERIPAAHHIREHGQTQPRALAPKRESGGPGIPVGSLAFGARTGIFSKVSCAHPVTALSKSFEKMLSRPWIRKRYGCSSVSASRNSRCVPGPKWDCQLLVPYQLLKILWAERVFRPAWTSSAGTSGTICDTVGSACPASPPPVRNGGAASDLLLRIMTRPSSRHTLSSHGQPAGVPGAAVSRGAVDHLVAGKAGIEGDA